MARDVRSRIVELAREAVSSEHARHEFNYHEVRPLELSWALPWFGDCSWFVKTVYWKAGCSNDPTGMNWDGYGNTVDLFYRGRHISQNELVAGDVIVFGPDGEVHAVLVSDVAPDPVCVSMGRQGDPSFVPLSVLVGLGAPTFLRFDTTDERLPTPTPRSVTRADLRKNQLVALENPQGAHEALRNGWHIFRWDGFKFVSPIPSQSRGTPEYANVHYRFKRP